MATSRGNPALWELIDQTRSLFHRLRRAAEEAHGQGALSGGRRGVLRDLARSGPQTVPQLARARPVSRQHIQSLVNDLLADGYVELVPNPAHHRSRLVRLTPAGVRCLRAMDRREATLMDELDISISSRRLRQAVKVLEEVREAFEGDRWQAAIRTVGAARRRGPSKGKDRR